MEVFFFGGSFNPPHQGHRHVIETISKLYPSDLLYVCPNFVSPFKLGEKSFTPEEIWKLCLAEFEGLLSKNVILWDGEIKQTNISYTIDSINTLQSLHSNSKISLVIGEDNLVSFDKWKSYLEILKAIKQIVVVRRETPYPKEIPIPEFLPSSQILVLENPILPMSSSEIRKVSSGDWGNQFVLPKTRILAMEFLNAKQGKAFE